MDRIYLSPPSVTNVDQDAVAGALRSGWIAPLGPEVDGFEADLVALTGRRHAVALSSGTAALHLGLLALGVGAGDEVALPTMTFGATAFAVTYVGAAPVFLDIEPDSWNLDPVVLEQFLERRSTAGNLPAAVITVDVFGRTCDYDRIMPICERYGVPVLADSAEAVGALHHEQSAGSIGDAGIFSFNGNKIITTSGGGMLVTDDSKIAERVRHWATQSREQMPWYEHEEIGFNYRMSNILAALGRAQLARLPEIVGRRRAIRDLYAQTLGDLDGVEVLGDPPWGRSNGWLTTVRFDAGIYPDAPRRVREALESDNIEARPVWKPMHQQPVFSGAASELTGVADAIFSDGLCLPSGTRMTQDDMDRVITITRRELQS